MRLTLLAAGLMLGLAATVQRPLLAADGEAEGESLERIGKKDFKEVTMDLVEYVWDKYQFDRMGVGEPGIRAFSEAMEEALKEADTWQTKEGAKVAFEEEFITDKGKATAVPVKIKPIAKKADWDTLRYSLKASLNQNMRYDVKASSLLAACQEWSDEKHMGQVHGKKKDTALSKAQAVRLLLTLGRKARAAPSSRHAPRRAAPPAPRSRPARHWRRCRC